MKSTPDIGKKRLLFSIEENDTLHLHVSDTLIIPFRDLEEWKEFAQDMLDMTIEIELSLGN